MTSIEERIVSLGFNNQNFEKHAEQSLSTLDKLDHALDTLGGSKGIAALADTMDLVASKFSVVGTVGDQVLRRLADGAMDVANKFVQLGKSLSVDQITAGFNKFGEKTTAVATLTAQGYELEKVNSLMNDLNWFTDETSYNFTDMVSNIAKFTATGQDLDSSVTAMEGIALWAALSGQNAQKASSAMYQLSQAMTKGALRFDDWKSIQNASMDTKEFREQAVQAAVEAGQLKEVAEGIWETTEKTRKSGQQFTLQELFSSDAMTRTEWLSSDAMMNVFNRYSKAVKELQRYIDDAGFDTASEAMDDLEKKAKKLAETAGISVDEAFKQLGYDIDEFSLKAFKAGQQARTWTDVIDSVKDAVSTGWMNTFEKLIGNSDEATKNFTAMANGLWEVFAAGGEVRNAALDIWRSMGGFEKLWSSLGSIGNNLIDIIDQLRGGLLGIFGPELVVSSEDLDYTTAQMAAMVNNITSKLEQNAKNFDTFAKSITQFNVIPKIIEGLHSVFMGLKVPVVLLGKAFHEAFDPIFNVYNGKENALGWPRVLALHLNELSTKFLDASNRFNEFMRSSNTIKSLSAIARGVASAFDIARMIVESFFRQFQENGPSLSRPFARLLDDLARVGRFITSIRDKLDASGILDRVMSTVVRGFNAISSVGQVAMYLIRNIVTTITGGLSNAGGVGLNLLDIIDKILNGIISICNAILDNNSFDGISNVLEGIFKIISKGLEILTSGGPFTLIANGLQKIAEWGRKAFTALSEGYKNTFGGGNSLGTDLIKIVTALGAAFLGFKKISGLSFKKDEDGILGRLLNGFDDIKENISDVLGGVKNALNSFANGTNAKALKDVALGVAILTAALFVLSIMNKEALIQSLLTITVGLGELIGSLAILNTFKIKKGVTTDLLKVAAAVLMFALAIGSVSVATLILAAALKVLSSIDPGRLWNSIAGMAVTLAVITGALILLSKFASGPKMIAAGIAIVAVAAALTVLSLALIALSLVPFDKLKNGLLAMAIILVEVGAALALLSLVGLKIVVAAAGVLIIAAAIVVLTAALVVLALIPGDAIAKGLVALTASLVVMVAALLLLSAAGPMVLAAGAALLLLGGGLLLASVGMLLLAKALAIIEPFSKKLPKIAGGLALIGASMLALGIGGIAAGLGIVGFLAMLPLGFALNLMAGLDLKGIAAGLALLGAAFIPLGLGGAVLGLGALGLIAGALGLASLSLALPGLADGIKAMAGVKLGTMLSVAAGLAALGVAGVALTFGALGLGVGAPALIELGEALPTLAEGLHSFETINWETIGKAFVILAESVGALFVLEFATIHNGVPVLIELAEALPTLAEGFQSFVGVDSESIVKTSQALSTSVKNLFGLEFATLINDGTPALERLASVLPTLSTGFKSFEDLDSEVITVVGLAMKKVINALFGAGLASLVDGTEALMGLGNALPVLSAGFRTFEGLEPEWIQGIATGLANGIKALTGDFFSNLFSKMPDFTGLATGITTIAFAVSQVPIDAEARLTGIAIGIQMVSTITVESLNTISIGLTTMYTTIDLTMTQIQTTVTTHLGEISIAFTTFITETQTTLDTSLASAEVSVSGAMQSIAWSINDSMSQIYTSVSWYLQDLVWIVSDYMNSMVNEVYSIASSMYDAGASVGANLAEGLRSQAANVRQAAAELSAAASMYSSLGSLNAFSDYGYSAGYSLGQSTGYGISAGIGYTNKITRHQISETAQQLIDEYRNSMGIRSPSRVMAELSKYIPLGIAQGIQNGSGEVLNAMSDTIAPIISSMLELMDSDFDFSPTITPVVDLSNAEEMSDRLSGMFNGSNQYTIGTARNIAGLKTVESGFGNYNSTVGDTINATINVYAQPGQNVNELATEIERRLVKLNKQQRLGALA